MSVRLLGVKTRKRVIMAAPYSDDIRQKVMKALDNGMRKTEVASVFNVSRNTIALWLKRREVTAEFKAKTSYQKGRRYKIIDWDKNRRVCDS